jgi:hypothetical protein
MGLFRAIWLLYFGSSEFGIVLREVCTFLFIAFILLVCVCGAQIVLVWMVKPHIQSKVQEHQHKKALEQATGKFTFIISMFE